MVVRVAVEEPHGKRGTVMGKSESVIAKIRKNRAIEMLEDAGPNAVVYSKDAWAAARKSSGGRRHDQWFPDRGSHATQALSPIEMAEWVTDWQLLREDEATE